MVRQRVNITIDEKFLLAVKVHCRKKGYTVSGLIERLLREFLEKERNGSER